MKILLLCLKGFETMEFSPFIDIMGWARNDFDIDISVVTCGFTEKVTSAFNTVFSVDVLLNEVNADDYDAIAIPGGFEEYGFLYEAYDNKTLELIRQFDCDNKYIASVCVGALPIAKSGVLKGRKGTIYHLDNGKRRKQLENMGVILGDEWLVVDRNIITSSCPKTASDVAFTLLEKLTSNAEMIKGNL